MRNNLSQNRLDISFDDSDFVERLIKWKELCKSAGGQKARVQFLISNDVEGLYQEVKNKILNNK